MLGKLFKTDSNVVGLIARIVLGIVILPHGLQKLIGAFGGYGFSNTIGYFTGTGIPMIIAFLIIMAESFGALGLITGFLSRFSAFGISLNMLGAIMLVHLPNGFFMNWSGQQQGEGFEFHILALGLALLVMIFGGGKWSIDKLITDRFFPKQTRKIRTRHKEETREEVLSDTYM
jgi:putative oxidoreductase